MNIITMICPEMHVGDANNLIMALGAGSADGLTFDALGWQDADGARYSVASWDASQDWLGPLVRPGWDADSAVNMAAAGRAQGAVVLHDPGEGDAPAPVPKATDAALMILLGEPMVLAAAAGLVQIVEGDT